MPLNKLLNKSNSNLSTYLIVFYFAVFFILVVTWDNFDYKYHNQLEILQPLLICI
ncbi:hypothetical protein HanXRQr2_Chr11g0507951 [Helianthus annuus]|uniref:Uncharacterized protein n=1 Tax=Helianthus annuus TaxID=4232 RepID=A0A251TFF1_HELAN|nr:hypothetical protein HanXRQr2_Chr11g0507951 [Helianthus annuus]